MCVIAVIERRHVGDKDKMVAEPKQRYHASDWLGGMCGDKDKANKHII